MSTLNGEQNPVRRLKLFQVNYFLARFFCHTHGLNRTAAPTVFVKITNADIAKFRKICVPIFHAVFGVVFGQHLCTVGGFKNFSVHFLIESAPTYNLFLGRTRQY